MDIWGTYDVNCGNLDATVSSVPRGHSGGGGGLAREGYQSLPGPKKVWRAAAVHSLPGVTYLSDALPHNNNSSTLPISTQETPAALEHWPLKKGLLFFTLIIIFIPQLIILSGLHLMMTSVKETAR